MTESILHMREKWYPPQSGVLKKRLTIKYLICAFCQNTFRFLAKFKDNIAPCNLSTSVSDLCSFFLEIFLEMLSCYNRCKCHNLTNLNQCSIMKTATCTEHMYTQDRLSKLLIGNEQTYKLFTSPYLVHLNVSILRINNCF